MKKVIKVITILIILLILFMNQINSYAKDISLNSIQPMIDYYPREINSTIKIIIPILLIMLLVLNFILERNKKKKIITTILCLIFGILSMDMMEYFHYGPGNGRINKFGDITYIIVVVILLRNCYKAYKNKKEKK